MAHSWVQHLGYCKLRCIMTGHRIWKVCILAPCDHMGNCSHGIYSNAVKNTHATLACIHYSKFYSFVFHLLLDLFFQFLPVKGLPLQVSSLVTHHIAHISMIDSSMPPWTWGVTDVPWLVCASWPGPTCLHQLMPLSLFPLYYNRKKLFTIS